MVLGEPDKNMMCLADTIIGNGSGSDRSRVLWFDFDAEKDLIPYVEKKLRYPRIVNGMLLQTVLIPALLFDLFSPRDENTAWRSEATHLLKRGCVDHSRSLLLTPHEQFECLRIANCTRAEPSSSDVAFLWDIKRSRELPGRTSKFTTRTRSGAIRSLDIFRTCADGCHELSVSRDECL